MIVFHDRIEIIVQAYNTTTFPISEFQMLKATFGVISTLSLTVQCTLNTCRIGVMYFARGLLLVHKKLR